MVVDRSFPELRCVPLRVRSFHSQSDYFQARFSPGRALIFARMRYTIFVNAALEGERPPQRAMEAIVAHELEHICWYRNHSRWRWLGLIDLVWEHDQERFEKQADVGAINRGYGPGLADYRRWLYQHVSPKVASKKRRIYLTPEEIDRISTAGAPASRR